MTDKLSRRSLLKMAAVLAATGALNWKSGGLIEAKTDIAPYIGVDPAVTGGDETAEYTLVIDSDDVLHQPFAPYYIDPVGLRELWDDQGQWIEGEGKLNSLAFDGMVLRKAKIDD